MSWYDEYKDQWREIIETVAAEERRTTQMVEKDTIQSMIILDLSKSEIPFVFKGGTSLSKAYGLIDRFSEDIDLSMNRKPTESEKKKTKNIITEIGLNCLTFCEFFQKRKMSYKWRKASRIIKNLQI